MVAVACSDDDDYDLGGGDGAEELMCSGLFGSPNEMTGLDESQCSPVCDCEGCIDLAPEPTDEFLAELAQWTHLSPFDELLEDPYEGATPEADPPGTVCAVVPEPGEGPRGYELATYPSAEAAEDDGAFVTHTGGCGLCSNLHNLIVYAAQNDLTAPVRECGFLAFREGQEANIDCLLELGFDLPCAQIWYHNTTHTRENCLSECLLTLREPYHNPDGSLNDCLQCDEDTSGPVFKKYAGRTRRNSGFPNSMCRPWSEVEAIPHNYH